MGLAVSMRMREMVQNVFGADHHHTALGARIPRIESTDMVMARAVYGVVQAPEGAAVATARIEFMFIKARNYAN
jgi:hypothetical protein